MDRGRLKNVEDTLAFGRKFAKQLAPGDVVLLHGELGAGKTTFVQGVLEGLHVKDIAQSPTFSYLHIYENVHHFDLYRLKSSSDFVALGFDDFLHDPTTIKLIEWPERIEELLPPHYWDVRLAHAEHERLIEVTRC